MKRGTELKKKLTEKLSDQMESFPLQPLLEVCGDRRVLIENHKGVKEYGPNKISVCVRYGRIEIFGEGLRLCRMCGPQLVILGRVDGITVVRGKM